MNRNFVLGLLIGGLGVLIVLMLFPLHHSTSADTSRAVQLHEGWNLLVWTGDSQAADTALAPIADKMPIAYSWQADSRTFGLYVPNRPDISTMGQVEKDTGYWVLMVDGATLNVPTASLQCPQPSPCPTPTACPDCGEWQSLAQDCVADFSQCADDLSSCSNELFSCREDLENCADTTEVCGLIRDLQIEYDGAVPILDQYSLYWMNLTFVVDDLHSWRIWNCY